MSHRHATDAPPMRYRCSLYVIRLKSDQRVGRNRFFTFTWISLSSKVREVMLNLIYAWRTGSWELYLSCIKEMIPWAFAYDHQNYACYLIPSQTTCVICQSECRRCTHPSTEVIFPLRWGAVILSDETKLTKPLRTPLVTTAKQEEVTLSLVLILPGLRDGCSMTQGVVCTGSFFVSICLFDLGWVMWCSTKKQ